MWSPRLAPAWADMLTLRRAMAAERLEGLAGFRDAVRVGIFPHEPHQVPMRAGEHQGDFTLHRQEKLRCSDLPATKSLRNHSVK